MKNISDVTAIITGAVGIAYVREVLGVIILILSILNILINMCFRIYNRIKNKQYEKIPQDIQDTIDTFKNLEDKDETNK